MTKKFGDHKLDAYIKPVQKSDFYTGKYKVRHQKTGGVVYFNSIAEARSYQLVFGDNEFTLAVHIDVPSKPASAVKNRPVAKPAAKVYVPKSTDSVQQHWPFPYAGFKPKKSAEPKFHTVTVGGVTVEYEDGISIDYHNKRHIKLVKT